MGTIRRNFRNMLGWRTDRKIMVIESDDWGTTRMPSTRAFDRLQNAGLDLVSRDGERYARNDTLATSEDLSLLFEVLSGFRDINGRPCVFTPMSIMVNPDFEKIRKDGFQHYHYEYFTETLKRYKGCEGSFEMWKEGIREKLFVPELHGREHMNVTAWMKALQAGDEQTLLAFDEGVWTFRPAPGSMNPSGYLAAFQLFDPSEIEYHKVVIKEATGIFLELFGFRAQVFVAPNNKYNNALNSTLLEHGIQFKAAARKQMESLGKGQERKVYNLRQRSKSGLWYLFRNAFFEPNLPGKDWVDSCLSEMGNAFAWKKAAIVSAHRTSFVGGLHVENRDQGLRQLRELIQRAQKRWPDLEFMTSTELGNLMKNGK